MSPEEFIENLLVELELRNELYLPSSEAKTEVSDRIKKLGLSTAQASELMSIFRQVLVETTYGLLCGIEGTASIGNSQNQYRLIAESGQELTGKLDSLFYERAMS